MTNDGMTKEARMTNDEGYSTFVLSDSFVILSFVNRHSYLPLRQFNTVYRSGGFASFTEIPNSEMPACLQALSTSATR
jgi:hypothetical protein